MNLRVSCLLSVSGRKCFPPQVRMVKRPFSIPHRQTLVMSKLCFTSKFDKHNLVVFAKNGDGREDDDVQPNELEEALGAFERFKEVMKSKVPEKREVRKGFSVYESRYWRELAYYAAGLLGSYLSKRARGSGSFWDRIEYLGFTAAGSTGMEYVIELFEHAIALRWVKETKETARSHYTDLVAEIDQK